MAPSRPRRTPPGLTAEGVDISEISLAHARGDGGPARRAGPPGPPPSGSRTIHRPAPVRPRPVRRRSHAFGGLLATLAAARRHLAPGGRVLVGDGFWRASRPPRPSRCSGTSPICRPRWSRWSPTAGHPSAGMSVPRGARRLRVVLDRVAGLLGPGPPHRPGQCASTRGGHHPPRRMASGLPGRAGLPLPRPCAPRATEWQDHGVLPVGRAVLRFSPVFPDFGGRRAGVTVKAQEEGGSDGRGCPNGDQLRNELVKVSAEYEGMPGDIARGRELARRFLARVRAAQGLPVSDRATDLVQLVVSELLTNACNTRPAPHWSTWSWPRTGWRSRCGTAIRCCRWPRARTRDGSAGTGWR